MKQHQPNTLCSSSSISSSLVDRAAALADGCTLIDGGHDTCRLSDEVELYVEIDDTDQPAVISAAANDDDEASDLKQRVMMLTTAAAAAPGYVAVIDPVGVPAASGKRWKSPHVVAYSTC